MELVSPTKQFEQSWLTALSEFEAEKRQGFWNWGGNPTNLDDYIWLTDNNSKGLDLPDNWVPSSTFWLIDNDKFVGHVNIRHKLNEYLEKVGGHIGYYIRPTARDMGYGTKILKLALLKAREIGLTKVLITCDDDNIASARVAEKNGGVFERTGEYDGGMLRYYWITLRS